MKTTNNCNFAWDFINVTDSFIIIAETTWQRFPIIVVEFERILRNFYISGFKNEIGSSDCVVIVVIRTG